MKADAQQDQLIQTLKQAGMRITPQRRAICAYLSETDAHPTAAMVYDRLKPEMPSLSLMTVYNTLNTLADLGAIQVLGQAGDDTVHYDPETAPHINVVCVSCHKIIDIPTDQVAALQQRVNAASGYRILGSRLSFYGLCPDCLEQQHQHRH